MLSEIVELPAHSAGARVPRDASGRVHSVFHRACNIELRSGALLSSVFPELGNFPHGIVCTPDRSFAKWLRAGQIVHIDDAVLSVPACGWRLDFSAAPVWRGAQARLDARNVDTVRALDRFGALLRLHAPAAGLAPHLFSTDGMRSPLERAIGARFAQNLPRLARATNTGDARRIIAALTPLIGLGLGLTPSGDDFVVGYLAALWSRTSHEPHIAELLSALTAPLALLSLNTNAVSRQQIIDASHGCFSQRLDDVLVALADGQDLDACMHRALQIGHSSGSDTLCGLLFGLQTTSQTSTQRRRGRRGNPVGSAKSARHAVLNPVHVNLERR